MGSFRLNAKHVFLTYPHSDLNFQELYNFIDSKYPLEKAIISKEHHKDGTPHIHALLSFKKRTDIRDERVFDFQDRHPSMESIRNIHATMNYVKKEKDFEEFVGEEAPSDADPYEMQATSEKSFFQECYKKKIPFQYAQHAWRTMNTFDTTIYEDKDLPIPNPFLKMSFLDTHDDAIPPKTTVLMGPSGIGKTNWAIKNAPKPCLLVTHIDQLKNLKGFHKSIIFDDMCFTHWPREAQIHLVDTALPRAIHVRYGTALIPAGLTKIFTCNTPCLSWADAAIDRRINKIIL